MQLLLFSLVAACWAKLAIWDDSYYSTSNRELTPATSPEKKQSLSKTVALSQVASEGPEPVRITPLKAQQGIGSGSRDIAAEPKQLVAETAAEMFHGGNSGEAGIDDGISLAETLDERFCDSCPGNTLWVTTGTASHRKDHIEVKELQCDSVMPFIIRQQKVQSDENSDFRKQLLNMTEDKPAYLLRLAKPESESVEKWWKKRTSIQNTQGLPQCSNADY